MTADKFRLEASVQPQVWINDNAHDCGASIEFDAHEAMLRLPAGRFAAIAREIFDGRHDMDELAIDTGVIDEWLKAGKENTFLVSVDEEEFVGWLFEVGLTRSGALSIDEETLAGVREKCGSSPTAAPAP